MGRMLRASGNVPRMLSPTTTEKLAKRWLAALKVTASIFPAATTGSPYVDILVALYVNEDNVGYLAEDALVLPYQISPAVMRRWLAALAAERLIERLGGFVSLSDLGHSRVVQLLEALFHAQRELD